MVINKNNMELFEIFKKSINWFINFIKNTLAIEMLKAIKYTPSVIFIEKR